MAEARQEMPIHESFPLSFDISGRRIVVTGAGRGLGRVIATALARSGAQLGLVARTDEQLRELQSTLPGEHVAIAGDVRSENFNQEVADRMCDFAGGLDGWIANAGISPVLAPVSRTDHSTLVDIFDTNLVGAFLGVKAAAGCMEDGGRIVVTSSVIGQRSMTGLGAYAASKAGVDALVRTSAIELAERNITVNGVAPGWYDSPLASGLRESESHGGRIVRHTPLGRWGAAEDLVGIYQFLLSDAARFITGVVVPVDGGYLLP